MTQWDSGAATRLEAVVADLRERGVIDVVHELASRVWRANLERYEPRELGDTTRWLGMSAAGDLTQLVGRHYSGSGAAAETGVQAFWPEGALVLRADDVRVHLMKAPAAKLRTPVWSNFAWSAADSRSRLLAARRNTALYLPTASDQEGRASMLTAPEPGGSVRDDTPPGTSTKDQQDPLWAPSGDPSRLTEMMLVWSGEPEQAVTAGWLGVPCTGTPPWYAVAALWWDETVDIEEDTVKREPHSRLVDDFSDRQAPVLHVGLKRSVAGSGTFPVSSGPEKP